MSGLLDADELAALRKLWADYGKDELTESLFAHIDALQAELDRARAEKLHHAETLGYINVKPVNGDTQLLIHDDDGALFPTLDAATDALYGPRWHVAAVLPLSAFHQDPQ